ncbi:hypothetical protein [Thiohalorhabdus methylotrophus]|uniref:Uncharacterized protein n=1 Tax=Thiohalorhabdus methylotrophus TaxID=3242694 RepID=A0ABV4TSY0_9GAMM
MQTLGWCSCGRPGRQPASGQDLNRVTEAALPLMGLIAGVEEHRLEQSVRPE